MSASHIIIGNDRVITVPEELKKIAVQYDHNVETVTFDCPRYWNGLDMSKMKVYINYLRADSAKGQSVGKNIVVDGIDSSIMHFDWTITNNVSAVNGKIFFLVCIKSIDDAGDEENHWNSELCQDLFVSEGLECGEMVLERYPDVITQILVQLDGLSDIEEKCERITKEFEFYPVTLADIPEGNMDMAFTLNTTTGMPVVEHAISFGAREGYCVYTADVKAGDRIVLTNAHMLTSDSPIVCFGTNRHLNQYQGIESIREFRDNEFEISNDGFFYICFDYTTIQTGEFFYIKRPNANMPLVLYAEKSDEYLEDYTMGEKAIKAIMEGKQIYVRVPNADGGNYTAVYSPIMTYQLPNYENNYLYLFYLRDEKQNIDLSTIGLGIIQMPVYGELKMKLSRDYNQTPLT